MWNLKRHDTNELTYKMERLADFKNELRVSRKKNGGKG